MTVTTKTTEETEDLGYKFGSTLKKGDCVSLRGSLGAGKTVLAKGIARSLGIKIERTKICGGGAKSPLWKKIIANVMNLKVDVLENEEGPSMGGAMLAAVGCGAYPDVETIGKKLAKVVDTVEPEPELVAKYEERYQEFKRLYPTMKPLF